MTKNTNVVSLRQGGIVICTFNGILDAANIGIDAALAEKTNITDREDQARRECRTNARTVMIEPLIG
jgi:hypothetical protein